MIVVRNVFNLKFGKAKEAKYEKQSREMMTSPEFGDWYQRFTPLVESGSRQIYSVVV